MTELLNPTTIWKNQKGEVVFALKRKAKYGPVYYIFEKHLENMDTVDRVKFEQVWKLVKMKAHDADVALYDVEEMKLLQKRAVDKYMKETEKG